MTMRRVHGGRGKNADKSKRPRVRLGSVIAQRERTRNARLARNRIHWQDL